jgi:hypothetical protein
LEIIIKRKDGDRKMANISDDDLRAKLFPRETIDFLESHPGYFKRASKMYFGAGIRYAGKAAKNKFSKTKEELNEVTDMVNSYPNLFSE